MLLGFVLGVCLMSVCAFFAIVAIDEGHETLAIILTGPFAWVYIPVGGLIYRLIVKIRLFFFRRNYDAFKFYVGGSYSDTYYIHKSVSGYFYRKQDNPKYYVEFMKDCSEAKSLPLPRFKITPKGLRHVPDYKNDFLANYIWRNSKIYHYFTE